MNVGVLVLRLVVGVLLAGHGAQKAFGWFGGRGYAATSAGFESIGYRPGPVMAGLAVLGELGGGVLLAVGLFTPLAAAAVVGVMVNAASTHWPNGLWSTRGGFEYPMVLGTVGAAIGFMGPGRLSLDRAAGWALAGNGWGAAALLVGVLSAAAALLAKTRQGSDHRSLSRA